MSLKLHLCIFLCYVYCSRFASASLSDQLFENKVDQFVLKGMLCHNNPGLSLSVVQDGRVLLAKGYGFRSTENLEPVTNKTLFQIASLSKGFAATLMLKQIEEHKNVSLSTTVRDILGRDDSFYGYLRSRYTTLEDLLAHRTGIPKNNNIRLDDKLTRQNLIERIKYLRAVGGFRTSFYYNNLIYGLVTYLSEVIGGSTWEDLVRTKLFEPLDMTSSTFVTTADPTDLDMATGYQDKDGELLPVPWEFSRRWGLLCGSGCVISNSLDMAKWMLFHLNEGRNVKNEQVLGRDLLVQAHSPQNSISRPTIAKYYTRPLAPVTFSTNYYGLGWKLGYYRGYPVLSHTGSTYGYRSSILLIPSLNIGVFMTMTGDDDYYMFRTNIQLYIADLLSGHVPWLTTDTVCTFPEPWQPKKTSTSSPVRKDIEPTRSLYTYEGLYRNVAYGDVDVYFNKTSGFLTALYGFGIFDLYPKTTPDNFFAEGYGIIKNIKDFKTLEFEINSKGTATKLIIPSMEYKKPPEFKRIGGSRSQRHATPNDAHESVTHNFVLPLTLGILCSTYSFV